MLRACYLLDDVITKISRMGKAINANSDLEVLRNRLRFEYRNATVFFNELLCTVDCKRYSDIYESSQTFNNITNRLINEEIEWTEIKRELESLHNSVFGGTDYIEFLDEYDLTYKARQQHGEYDHSVNLGDDDLRAIARSFNTGTNRPVNFLDARCKNGYNSNEMKKYSIENLVMYGMEKDPTLANTAKDRNCFTKIAKGGLTGSKCSNNVFDVAYLFPTLTFVAEITPMGTLRPRRELEELRQVTKYLRADGLVLYAIPFFRLTSQLCTFIAKNYKDVTVHNTGEWGDLLLIAGLKNADDKDADETIYNRLRQLSLTRPNSNSGSTIGSYTLPPDLLQVELFRGNVLDDEDIDDIINDTGLYESFMTKQANILESTEDKQPLLPFNIGQIGLVLTSGCLDGEIEELDGQYHVIKGMVKKDTIIEEVPGERRGDTETRTTYVNKVQINVVTPDGTFKTLA